MKQNSPLARSGEAKPKIDITFKEYINGIIKMSCFTLSQDSGAARHCIEFENSTFKARVEVTSIIN